jgi:hypothetical protein
MTLTGSTPPAPQAASDGWLSRVADIRQTLVAGFIRKLIDDVIDLIGTQF